jgi:hypothetical protein
MSAGQRFKENWQTLLIRASFVPIQLVVGVQAMTFAGYEDDDLRELAQAFEAMSSELKVGHARDIYRGVGDRDKYLELRTKRMKYGADYLGDIVVIVMILSPSFSTNYAFEKESPGIWRMSYHSRLKYNTHIVLACGDVAKRHRTYEFYQLSFLTILT